MAQRVAIVTGAASGIGKALATRLVEKNWLVALLDINEEVGTELAKTLEPTKTIFIPTDVSSHASQAAAFATTFARFGRIDALCANAGIIDRSSLYLLSSSSSSTPTTVSDVPAAPDLSATDVDLKGVIYGVQLATHFMRFNPPFSTSTSPHATTTGEDNNTKEKNGNNKKIVITSSIAGSAPHPSLPEYSAAKAGVIGFVRAVGPVLRDREGIAISAVCPGLAATAILPGFVCDAVGDEYLTPVGEVVDSYLRFLETEGLGKAGEVVEVVGTGSCEVVPPPKVRTELARVMMERGMEPIFGALHGGGGESKVDLEGFF